jgi:transposase-like protein
MSNGKTFTQRQRDEIVKYATATSDKEAAAKFKVGRPTVWKWRTGFREKAKGGSMNTQTNGHKNGIQEKNGQQQAAPKQVRRYYTDAEKAEIVAFARSSTSKGAAEKYGIHPTTVKDWRAAAAGKARYKKKGLRRGYTADQKAEILRDAAATSVTEAAKKHHINASLIFRWRKTPQPTAPAPKKKLVNQHEALDEMIAQQRRVLDDMKVALERGIRYLNRLLEAQKELG